MTMVEKGFNAFKMAQEQFDKVADQLDLEEPVRKLLREPMREYHFLIPIRMDNGSYGVFKGFRIQHNDARGRPVKEEYVFIHRRPPIPYVHYQCG